MPTPESNKSLERDNTGIDPTKYSTIVNRPSNEQTVVETASYDDTTHEDVSSSRFVIQNDSNSPIQVLNKDSAIHKKSSHKHSRPLLVKPTPRIHDFFEKQMSRSSNNANQEFTHYLRPKAQFIGTQEAGSSTYEVEVEFKSVDLENSFVSGFLKIHGLTEENPEISTYFRGEIIGSQYSYLTDNLAWGSFLENDLQHWKRLTNNYDMDETNLTKYLETLNSPKDNNFLNNNCIYMRWKEEFLVPDSTIRSINRASFEGFYYICLNQSNGAISGLYYFKTSEKFQQLQLSYVANNGKSSNYEFC